MSSLARALLAFTAAALIAACAAEIDHCAALEIGDEGFFQWTVIDKHITQTDSVIDLPVDQCPYISHMIGMEVTACDPFGPPPEITLLDEGLRVRIKCSWGSGQTCPEGLDVLVRQNCLW